LSDEIRKGHEVLMATIIKVTVLWDMTPCSLYRGTNLCKKTATFILRVKGVHPEDGGSRFLRKVCVFNQIIRRYTSETNNLQVRKYNILHSVNLKRNTMPIKAFL
jgi:hypothetical protein